MKSINELCNEAYQNAVDKGWWEKDRPFGEVIALIHSELSEALEDYRNGRGFNETWYDLKATARGKPPDVKPCGIPSELADVIIRILDFCGRYEINLQEAIEEKMQYNATRPVRHGGKII